jgi:hypothetical protein
MQDTVGSFKLANAQPANRAAAGAARSRAESNRYTPSRRSPVTEKAATRGGPGLGGHRASTDAKQLIPFNEDGDKGMLQEF